MLCYHIRWWNKVVYNMHAMTRNTPLLECRGYFATSISAQPASDGSDYRLVQRTPRRPLRACHHTSVAHRCNELENRPRSFAMADSWENSKLSGSSIDLTDTAAALQVYSTGICSSWKYIIGPITLKRFFCFACIAHTTSSIISATCCVAAVRKVSLNVTFSEYIALNMVHLKLVITL